MIDRELLKEKFIELAGKNGLILGVLFGSQATGKTHRQSDVDIGILADHPLRPIEIARLAEEFKNHIGREDIEITDLKTAPPLLLRMVAEEGILLYEKENDFFDRFKIYGIKLYIEAQPLLKLREQSIKNFIQKYA